MVDAAAIGMTATAQKRLEELLQQRSAPLPALRVYVSGGGCSGFQYGFKLDGAHEEGDIEISLNDGLLLRVDPMSYQYLAGSEIDYSSGLEGSRFVVRNPNAVATCGCGMSFTV